MTMTHIETIELGTTAASITFSAISQDYTDLMILVSPRSNRAAAFEDGVLEFNGNTSNFTGRNLWGTGSTVGSGTIARFIGFIPAASQTADTFGSFQIYVSNYTEAVAKSFSGDFVFEANSATAYQGINAGLWDNTSAITSITLATTVASFIAGTTASLYGIS